MSVKRGNGGGRFLNAFSRRKSWGVWRGRGRIKMGRGGGGFDGGGMWCCEHDLY